METDPGQGAFGWARVGVVPDNRAPLPDFTRWPSFPFEGDLRVKELADPVAVEPPRSGEDAADCVACNTPDEAYIWVSERWRVRAMDRPTGLPIVLILECRSHLDLGDLPNLLAAELGVMTVRLERAVRSLDGVARVHVNRWGDGSAHLHMWFLARPYGRLQLRGTFLSLWDDILPVIPEWQWRENLALVAAWLAEFGGRALAEPPHIHWQSPSTIDDPTAWSSSSKSSTGAGAGTDSALNDGEPAAGAVRPEAAPATSAGSQTGRPVDLAGAGMTTANRTAPVLAGDASRAVTKDLTPSTGTSSHGGIEATDHGEAGHEQARSGDPHAGAEPVSAHLAFEPTEPTHPTDPAARGRGGHPASAAG